MMWYDNIINELKNSPDNFHSYVSVTISEGYDKYTKEQIIELFCELLEAIELTNKGTYLEIIKDMVDDLDFNETLSDSFKFPWYGEINNIILYNPTQLTVYIYKNITNYNFIQIAALLQSLVYAVDNNCSTELKCEIYNEFIESLMWLYRKKEFNKYVQVDEIITCGKYSLLSINNGLDAFMVVSDYDRETKTWVEEKRFNTIENGLGNMGGMSQVKALKEASNFLWELIKE